MSPLLEQPWLGYLLFAMAYFSVTLWAIAHVLGGLAKPAVKGRWVAFLLLLPLLSVFCWLLVGPRRLSSPRTC